MINESARPARETGPKRVEENAGAAALTLTEADLAAIDEILPHGGFGARYAEGHVPTWI
ncbi:hypothetical protein [Streptomyces cupreus]|uniref:hypothetical protein n=1 Tax=Streptomyces cupreus TaxID=2759956 RepID=UPI00300DBDD1